MSRVRSRYTNLGVVLITAGVFFAAFAEFILEYTPLTASGIAAVILGIVSISLARTLPNISIDAGEILFSAGLDNIQALIEELGLGPQAIYLPTSITKGNARALIPTQEASTNFKNPFRVQNRLLVQFSQNSDDLGILVATPGSAALSFGSIPPSSFGTDLEDTLTMTLVGSLDLARTVSVSRDANLLNVTLSGVTFTPKPHPANDIIGTPLASIAATIAAEVLDNPITVTMERSQRTNHIIQLQIIELPD